MSPSYSVRNHACSCGSRSLYHDSHGVTGTIGPSRPCRSGHAGTGVDRSGSRFIFTLFPRLEAAPMRTAFQSALRPGIAPTTSKFLLASCQKGRSLTRDREHRRGNRIRLTAYVGSKPKPLPNRRKAVAVAARGGGHPTVRARPNGIDGVSAYDRPAAHSRNRAAQARLCLANGQGSPSQACRWKGTIMHQLANSTIHPFSTVASRSMNAYIASCQCGIRGCGIRALGVETKLQHSSACWFLPDRHECSLVRRPTLSAAPPTN